MADVRFDQLNIVVDDMEAAVAFYRSVGFTVDDVPEEWSAWAPHHRTISTPEGLAVDLDSAAFAKEWGNVGVGVVVTVRMPSREAVDERYAALVAAGHDGLKAPYDAFWGARYAIVRDPAGNAVGLMSEADEAFRQAGPEPPA